MAIELDVSGCLKQAREFIDLANASNNAELRSNYLELAKHYTQLAGILQRAAEPDSKSDNRKRDSTD